MAWQKWTNAAETGWEWWRNGQVGVPSSLYNGGTRLVLGNDEVEALCARLDEAFRTLSHPLRGKRYRRYHRFSGASDQPGNAEVVEPGPRSWVQLSLPLMYDEQQRSASIKAATDCELLALVTR